MPTTRPRSLTSQSRLTSQEWNTQRAELAAQQLQLVWRGVLAQRAARTTEEEYEELDEPTELPAGRQSQTSAPVPRLSLWKSAAAAAGSDGGDGASPNKRISIRAVASAALFTSNVASPQPGDQSLVMLNGDVHRHSGKEWRHDEMEQNLHRARSELGLSTSTSPLQVVKSALRKIFVAKTPREDDVERGGSTMPALVEHCGWLLKRGRTVHSWKVRWVVLQAGYLWYFRDESRAELLGRMVLAGATATDFMADGAAKVPLTQRRHLVVRNDVRTLRLVTADEGEARAWSGALLRSIEEANERAKAPLGGPSSLTEGSKGVLHATPSLRSLLDILLPYASKHDASVRRSVARQSIAEGGEGEAWEAEGEEDDDEEAGAEGGDVASLSSSVASSSRHSLSSSATATPRTPRQSSYSYVSLNAEEEETLCTFILTVHSFCKQPKAESSKGHSSKGHSARQRRSSEKRMSGVPLHGVETGWDAASVIGGELLARFHAPPPECQPRTSRFGYGARRHRPYRWRIAYLLLRWAQIHPADFAPRPNGLPNPLRELWSLVMADGYLADLGVRTAEEPVRSRAVSSTRDQTSTAGAPAGAPEAAPGSAPTTPREDAASEAASEAAAPARRFSLGRASVGRQLPSASFVQGSSRLSTMGSPRLSSASGARQGPATLSSSALPSDAGPWLPFLRPTNEAAWAADAVAERSVDGLSAVECQQMLACLGSGLKKGGSRRGSDLKRAISKADALNKQGSGRSPKGVPSVGPRWTAAPTNANRRSALGGAFGGAEKDERALEKLRARLKSMLAQPPPTDATVVAEQWLALEPSQLAIYITLRDERCFHAITPAQLLSVVWKRKGEPGGGLEAANQQLLSSHFGEVAQVVASALVVTPRLTTRAALFAHFLAVAHELHRLHNFSSLIAVLSALSDAAVFRLRATKDAMGEAARGTLESLTELSSRTSNWRSYRTALAEWARCPPFIPYVGLHQTDLLHIADGNADLINGQINLFKRHVVRRELATVMSGSAARYVVAALPGIGRFMAMAPRLSETERYDRSMALEPRSMSIEEIRKLDEETHRVRLREEEALHQKEKSERKLREQQRAKEQEKGQAVASARSVISVDSTNSGASTSSCISPDISTKTADSTATEGGSESASQRSAGASPRGGKADSKEPSPRRGSLLPGMAMLKGKMGTKSPTEKPPPVMTEKPPPVAPPSGPRSSPPPGAKSTKSTVSPERVSHA